MEHIAHGGRTTAYRRVGGSGPAVLYVHGSGGTHRVWANQYTPMGPAHPAVALDLSGHGDSDDIDTAPGEATLSAYADDVVAVAEAVDADVLVGHSLGGAVAQWVALERDFQPDALVFAGTGPTLPVFEGLREWLDTDFERAVEFLHGRDRLFHTTDETLLAKSRDQLRSVGQAVTRRDFLTCHRFDVTGRLQEIEQPTLALCGEHDKLTPRDYHERLAREIPVGELAFVPDSAHMAMLERPETCNDILGDFLAARR